MTKPFRFEELLARVRVRLRDAGTERADGAARSAASSSTCARGGRTVDGRDVELTGREFALLETVHAPPRPGAQPRAAARHVWGYDFDPGSNVVDVYVGYLRRKLGADASRPCAAWATG